jgi:amidophosphoribosyltransferase
MARDAGAKNVYFASAAPPVRYPNVYGIDMPSAGELIANNRTVEQIQKIIGADGLIYQDLNDLIDSASEGNPQITAFDTSCFSKHYVTGDIDDDYLCGLEMARNEGAKKKNKMKPSKMRDVSQL